MSHVTHKWVMSHTNQSCHIWISHVTYKWVMSHKNESYHIRISHVTYEWVIQPPLKLKFISNLNSWVPRHTSTPFVSHYLHSWVPRHTKFMGTQTHQHTLCFALSSFMGTQTHQFHGYPDTPAHSLYRTLFSRSNGLMLIVLLLYECPSKKRVRNKFKGTQTHQHTHRGVIQATSIH